MASYVLLKEITLNATASSVTFSSIPPTGYDDLKIVYSGRSTRTGTNYTDDVYISFNSSVSDLTTRAHYSSYTGPGGFSTSTGYAGYAVSNSAGSSFFGATTIYIPKYAAGTPKVWSTTGSAEANSSSGVYSTIQSGGWNINTAISTITLTPGNGSWVSGSTFSLYGIAGVGTTPPAVPFASGGDIVTNDGTYWYHAFLTTGTFTPQRTLSSDVLVIAGGAGGGGYYYGGGGGAGGVKGFTSQSLLAQSYTCTVGAGGSGTGAAANAISGSNSQFGSLTPASVGGGYGATGGYTGGSGGSGGGGGGTGGGAPGGGGAGTSGQGNSGGSGYETPSHGGGGGGGGAGGSGTNASYDVGGTGGVGTSAYSSWGSTTGIGHNVSGTYYFAGGGGGGTYEYSTSANAGGNGGGGRGSAGAAGAVAVSGTANTGGGGGGYSAGGAAGPSGSGGSGVIIIRYPMA